MKLVDIISEIQYSMYQAICRIGHSKEINVQDVAELFRALPGVVTITQLSHDSERHTATMKIKILTTKDAATGFQALKSNAIKRIPEVKKLEVANKTIEKKK